MKLVLNNAYKGVPTSYRVTIGSKEAREVGFVSPDSTPQEIEKIVDPDHNQIIIRLKKEGD